jgi:serine/threonine-protein kinase
MSSPPIEERLEKMLQRWDELRRCGEEVSDEQLCADCPELAAELARRMRGVRALDPLLETAATDLVTAPTNGGGHPRFGGESPARYQRIRLHASGGLGQVYVARDQELGREVALKEIQDRHAHDPLCRARFVIEAEVTGGLEHPGIVPVYSLGHDPDGRSYYAMRFIRGESLKEAIEQFHNAAAKRDQSERTLQFRELLGRFVDVCNAIAYAHSRGVLHRDLKPGNIMLGKYGETLVVDWGLAKALNECELGEEPLRPPSGEGSAGSTRPGAALGTPAFMSPEQAAGQINLLGPASDVYSLGATLYCVLTGKPPFDEKDMPAFLKKVEDGQFPPPHAERAEVPRALDAVCMKAMAVAPGDRYASPKELADEIERWLADEPVSTWREPWMTRLARWRRRHSNLVTGAAALLMTAVVALALSTYLIGRQQAETERARTRAEQEHDRADANFRLARKAVDDTTNKVAENLRLKDADFHILRRELLSSAVPFYEQFVQQKSDDPKLEAERGRAYGRLASLRAEMGEKARAAEDNERARATFQRLADVHPAVPDYRSGLAASHINLGRVLRELGRGLEAEKSYRAALAVQMQLVRHFPRVSEYRQNLGLVHNNLGNLLSDQERYPEVDAEYRAAIAAQEHLVRERPGVLQYRQELARSHNNRAVSLRHLRRRSEAEAEYRAAAAEQERLVVDAPAVPGYHSELARTRNNLGILLMELHRGQEAESEFRTALETEKRLALDFPTVPEYRRDLAGTHNNLGSLLSGLGRLGQAEAECSAAFRELEQLTHDSPDVPEHALGQGFAAVNLGELVRKQGQPDAALAWFTRAIGILTRVLERDKRMERARQALSAAHRTRAEVLDQLGNHAEAEGDWHRALSLSKAAERETIQLLRAVALVRAGDAEQAVSEAEALTNKPNVSGEGLYNAACIHALASSVWKDDAPKAEKQAARAVVLLRRAEAEGYFRSSEVVGEMKQDRDLDVLRSRADYQNFLRDLTFPANPFAR